MHVHFAHFGIVDCSPAYSEGCFKDSVVTLQVLDTLNPQEMGLLVNSVFVKALCVCFSLIVCILIRLGQ